MVQDGIAAFGAVGPGATEMSLLGLVLVFASGVVTGLAFDLFALCTLVAPLFACVLAISVRQAGWAAPAIAAEAVASLQFGFIAGMALRGFQSFVGARRL